MQTQTYGVLLAGGTGTRLWPVSRQLYPKQLVRFIGRDSLVQNTIKRLAPLIKPENVRIVCGHDHYHEVARHMEEMEMPAGGKIIQEPCGRNTAPAILLAVLQILKKEPDAILGIFPADHVIADIHRFHARLKAAIDLADQGHIVTFGIQPGYPETGYGYIEGAGKVSDSALRVKRFVEKPDKATAARYVQAGNYYWNSGMFAFRASVLAHEFERLQPDMYRMMAAMMTHGDQVSRSDYEKVTSISIDYAIMEKTDKGVVLPSTFGWSDIGSWKSLFDFLPKDENNNVIDGDIITQDTRNCFIMGYKRLIATNRLDNMVVIETPDSVFVSDLETSRDVKTIVEQLKQKGRREYQRHTRGYHSWGQQTLLDETRDVTVDRLMLYAGARVSVTTGKTATAHLIVTRGTARLCVAGETDRDLFPGQAAAVSGLKTSALLINIGAAPLQVTRIRTQPPPGGRPLPAAGKKGIHHENYRRGNRLCRPGACRRMLGIRS